MRFRASISVFVLLISASFAVNSCSRPSDESLVVRGRFTTHRSASFKGGVALCWPSLYHMTLDSASALSDGSFVLPVRGKGVYKIVFAASGYPDLAVPLYIEKSVGLSIDLSDDKSSPPRIVFDNKATYTAELYDIYAEMTSYRPDGTGRSPGSSLRTNTEYASALSQYARDLERRISIEPDTVLRQALLIARLAASSYGDTLSPVAVQSTLARISPVHPYWSFAPYFMLAAAFYANYQHYLDIAIETHPDPWTRAWLMYTYLPSRIHTEDSTKARAYAARLVSEFPQTEFATRARPFLDMNVLEPTVGTVMPPFAFPTIEQSGAQIGNMDFKGKTYLISFWATWCKPCVNQIQFLSRAHDKFSKNGLEIVSVSLDDDPEKVRAFLKSKIVMPWRQAYAPGAFDNEFIKHLGIVFVPTEYLVDQEARILAVSADLIGPKLDLTLSRIVSH